MTTNSELKSFITRIETLDAWCQEYVEDIKSVYSEAKASGYDVKIMRKAVALRKIEKAEREEVEALVTTYLEAIEN